MQKSKVVALFGFQRLLSAFTDKFIQETLTSL